MGTTGGLTPDERAWFAANPRGGYPQFLAAGFARSKSSFDNHRARLVDGGVVERLKVHSRLLPKPGAPNVRHNKPDVSQADKALLQEALQLQAIAAAGRRSTNFPEFFIQATGPVPVIFVGDWHIGSWGTDHKLADAITDEIERLGLYVAVLGDMVQMAVNPNHGIASMQDIALDGAKQMRWMRAWLERLHPLILWSIWDNHAVIRQEKALGYSEYAELFKEKTVYSGGIAHIDLSIGPAEDDYETYRIATSHRFSGSNDDNPCRGGQQYLMRQTRDREIAVCGDSHRPGVLTYPHADERRCSINVGSLQTDSAYSKRVASLYTHADQPIVEFWPNHHHFHAYPDLADYKTQLALRK